MKLWIALCAGAALAAAGCGGGKLPEAKNGEKAELPEGHPAVDGPADAPMTGGLGSEGPTDENPLPLKLTGLNSAEELKRDLTHTENAEAREAFEAGYRKTFTAASDKRDYAGAVTDLQRATALDPTFAPAYRALGYAQFNLGFNVDAAMAGYTKSVELDPDYGEAHYALAFMYAMGDKSKGEVHFRRAMELGVPDERNLKQKFYPGN